MENFVVNAESRSDTGKGASRRLRRTDKIPGIVYGGGSDPVMIMMSHNEMEQHLAQEAFYSHILTLKLDGKEEKVVLKDLQRHPAKPFIQHMDFLRAIEGEQLRMTVPVHFINEASAPGVKQGGTATKYLTSIEVSCKPADLPEFLEIDMGDLEMSGSIHLADITLPDGVVFPALSRGPEHNYAVVAVLGGRSDDTDEVAEADADTDTGADVGTDAD